MAPAATIATPKTQCFTGTSHYSQEGSLEKLKATAMRTQEDTWQYPSLPTFATYLLILLRAVCEEDPLGLHVTIQNLLQS